MRVQDYLIQGTPWVALGAFIQAVLRGKLVPLKTVEARMKDKAERLEDKATQVTQWREAYENSEESRKTSEAQVDKLLEQSRTTNVLLTTLTESKRGVAP